MPDKNVTSQVTIGGYDEEMVAITRCVCGNKWHAWDFIISIYRDNIKPCPNCGRKLYCSIGVTVYEVVENA